MYSHKVEALRELEQLSRERMIDFFYGDESHVCSQGYVPYGWQFPDEEVSILSEKAYRINCFGLINRQSQCHWATTEQNIDAQFVLDFLDDLSLKIHRETFIVLDNASVHRVKIIRKRMAYWQARGLFIFFLPPYLPHLNIAETLWGKLKAEWLNPEDYADKDSLSYATNRCLANLGGSLKNKLRTILMQTNSDHSLSINDYDIKLFNDGEYSKACVLLPGEPPRFLISVFQVIVSRPFFFVVK